MNGRKRIAGRRRSWSLIVCTLLAACVVMGAVGCAADPTSPPLLRTGRDFDETLAKATELAKAPIEAVALGQTISESQRKDLVEADRLVRGLIAFDTERFGLYVLKGKIAQAVGDTKHAEECFNEAIRLVPMPETDDEKFTVAETHFQLSRIVEARQDWAAMEKQADFALRFMPDNPIYLVQSAAAKIQQGNIEAAEPSLRSALKQVPDFQRAKDLLKLIELAKAEPKR